METFDTNKNLGTVINRIGKYIVTSQIFFRTSGANLNLHNFVKIYSLFLFDDGTVDDSQMTVIRSLFKREGFSTADGWELKTWERELTIETKGKSKAVVTVTAIHKVLYIKHLETGTIITSQHKAWNDKVRMAMCIDLILKPEAIVRGGKLFLWLVEFIKSLV